MLDRLARSLTGLVVEVLFADDSDDATPAAVLEAITEESHAVIHASQPMKRIIELADQVAGSEANILITGESGTGKEIIARYIHRKSKRSGNNFAVTSYQVAMAGGS